MKFSLQHVTDRAAVLSLLLLQASQHVSAHYGFPFLIVDDKISARWEYIRPATSFDPNYDYSGPDSVCGFNGTKPLFPVKTMKVEAGSTITFGVSLRESEDESTVTIPWKSWQEIFHPGPATAYLSQASGELNDYEGDGDWFKIAESGASDGMNWDYSSPTRRNSMNFTIPKTTPPGKYLLRAEHFNISPYYKSTQMFINCAHVEINGPGGGKPGPMTKFPGAYDAKDPGIWLPMALSDPPFPMDELKNWQGAGPKVWKG